MPEEVKPEGLEFFYAVGDVVRLTTGQNAVIMGYGIYSGQYFCVKHFDDGIYAGSADYLCSAENPDAYKTDIVGIEDDAEKVLRVLRDYVKEDADMTAKVAAWNRRAPEPGTLEVMQELIKKLEDIQNRGSYLSLSSCLHILKEAERLLRENRREGATSVIRWTRYDGTPETLPETDGIGILLFREYNYCTVDFYLRYNSEDKPKIFINDLPCELIIGDLWSYLPEPPEGME